MNPEPLTERDIEDELAHIRENRLGEFCPNGEQPTAEQERLVAREQAEWYARYKLQATP